jgi:hypothetical protein
VNNPSNHDYAASRIALFIAAMASWSLLIVLLPASLTYAFISTMPQIDDTAAVVVAMGVGIGVGWVIGRATYRPLARWLDPTPRCKCGYDIRGIDCMLCPECGEVLNAVRTNRENGERP